MKKLSLFLVCIILLIGVFLWIKGTAPVNPKDSTKKTFVIAKGEGVHQISNELKDAGLITDSMIFYVLVKIGGYEEKIQAGDFQLSPSQSANDIITTLTKGMPDVWITIPEGKRATEIAQTLKQKISSYNSSWDQQLIAQEGYLFPDTYLFSKEATIDQIITIMKNNFTTKYQLASQDATVSFPQNQVVILASLVEREGNNESDMKYIASVLENRLSLGMALQVDSTIQYALGNPAHWWPTPSSSDLQIASAYNTYKNPGLPPTPIANPGLVALTAVLHPAKTNYIFYFTDKRGITHFAKTLMEQNDNIAKFGL